MHCRLYFGFLLWCHVYTDLPRLHTPYGYLYCLDGQKREVSARLEVEAS